MSTDNIIDIYEKVLDGHLKRFPPETWNPYKSGFDTAKRLLRYLIIDKLKWNREDFCENFEMSILQKYKLKGAMQGLYDNNIFPFVTDSFPEWEIHPWELKRSRVPGGYWTEENTRKAVRWMIEDQLKWNRDDILDNLSATTFERYHLAGMLQSIFKHSPYLAIQHAYPNENWEILDERKGYSMTFEDAQMIRELHEERGITQKELAKRYGVSKATISNVISRKIWNSPLHNEEEVSP